MAGVDDYLAEEYGDTYDANVGPYKPPAPQPAELRAYEPTWRDQLGKSIAGDENSNPVARWWWGLFGEEENSPFRRLLAQRLLGTSGLGPSADPEQPWRALPVAAPLIDAMEAAYNDQHGRFAARAIDTGLEAWGVGSLPGILARQAVKPPLPVGQRFHYPIMSNDAKVGYISGRVSGDKAHISEAFRTNADNGPFKHFANSVGYRDVRQAFDRIREDFPNTARVTAHRISGARTGKGAQPRFARSGENLDIQITPLWLQILNEAGRRGVR